MSISEIYEEDLQIHIVSDNYEEDHFAMLSIDETYERDVVNEYYGVGSSNYDNLDILLEASYYTEDAFEVIDVEIPKTCHKKRYKKKVMKPFYSQRYSGLWYEVAKKPNEFESPNSKLKCEGATSSFINENSGRIKLYNTCYYEIPNGNPMFSKSNPQYSLSGNAVASKREPAKMKVAFNCCGDVREGDYWVLDTDYTTYAIVGAASNDYLWFMSRKSTISKNLYKMMVQKSRSMGYNTSDMEKSSMITYE